MKKLLLVAAILIAVISLQAQCLMYPVLLNQRVPQSNFVIEGKVVDQKCFWNANHDKIYTSNLVEVYKTFKNSSAPFIEVITEGGIVGLSKHVFEPTLELEVGDAGIFTLNPNSQISQFGKPVYEAYASAQGFIKYNIATNSASEPFNVYQNASADLYNTIAQYTGENYVQIKPINLFQQTNSNNTTQAVAAITSFSPTTITAGTFSVLTINGSGFGATATPSLIAFKNADDGGATTISPIASQIVSWSATQIQVRVPSKAGTGVIRVNGSNSTATLTIPYSHINVTYTNNIVYNTKHVDQSGGGYIWTYNTSFNTNTAAKAAFERSLQSWRCATYINWPTSSTTSSITASANDGINIVTFNSSLGTGILGQCASYFSGCNNNGTFEWFVSELDIQFDPTPGSGTWQYGTAAPSLSQYDFESVTVHELGHGHQLGHVINSIDLMHYALANGQSKRNLNSDDLNGGLAVMARNAQTGGTCYEPLMTPLTSANCAIIASTPTAAISSASTGCTGSSITLTDASSGIPSSWVWTMPGGTPATATTQNASVTYSTAGVKTISLTVANATGTTSTTKTITITATPTVVASVTNTTICRGSSATQTLTGATTYTWLPSGSGSTNTLTPTATTIYSVSGTTSGCISSVRNFTITVTPTPTTNVSATSATICSGQTTTLTASGATSYSWMPAGQTTTVISVSPTSNTTYTVRGTNGSCSSTRTITVNVNTPPTITISITNTTICSGTSVTASASGATSYTWLPNGTGSSSNLSPASTTIYTVTGSTGSCASTPRNFTITVTPTPTTNVSTTSASICSGQTTTLTASGATSYSWMPTGQTTTVITVSPTSNTTYTVRGTNGSCSSTRTIAINVTTVPTITSSISNTTICRGSAVTVNLTGASAYTWLPNGTGSSSALSPSATTVYTVTGSNGSCTSAPRNFTINITQSPTINVVASPTLLCSGQTASLTATGASSYTWSPAGSLSSASGSVVVSNANSTTTYTISGTNAGCVGTKTITLNVSTCTGIENVSSSNPFLIYPNPSNGLFTISGLSNVEQTSVTVINTLGQTIFVETIKQNDLITLNFNNLSRGIYYAKISTKDGTNLVKLLLE